MGTAAAEFVTFCRQATGKACTDAPHVLPLLRRRPAAGAARSGWVDPATSPESPTERDEPTTVPSVRGGG